MKKKLLILLGVVIVVLIVILDSTAPQKINWHKTYHEQKKQPFDLKVFYEQLDTVFHDYQIETLKETFYEYQSKPLKMMMYQQRNCLYINIDNQFQPDHASEKQLLGYIGLGNIAFISANNFSKSLLDSLGVLENKRSKPIKREESLTLSLKGKTTLNYIPKLKYFQHYFKDSTNVNAIGHVKFSSKDTIYKKANFIEIPYKQGFFYLHTQPEIFTNYQLLKSKNTNYINKLLSTLPTRVVKKMEQDFLNTNTVVSIDNTPYVYFESNHKASSELINSPLRFIKAQKELNWAWKLILIGFAIFFIINAKRKQRIVPILPKVRNTSLEFVETVATLYEEADNFQPIIQQKIHIFHKNIRNRYNIVTDSTNTKLASQLSKKSGYELSKTKELIRFMNTIKNRETSSITLLTKLNTEIENFYKNTTAWKN